MEKIRVIVSIFGKEYSIASEVGAEYIQRAAEYLDWRMQEVANNFPNFSASRISLR
jgi:cell division protein ZapA (FtsZ GTPase activity inhibitor)